MRVVEVRHRLPDGDVESLARISLSDPDGAIVIEPTEHASLGMVEDVLRRAGVVDRLGAPIPWSSGDAFLRALPGSLRGSRLWAEEVVDDGGSTPG